MVFIYLNNVQIFVWSAESLSMEMDSLERLRSFMIAFADVRQHNPKYETVSDLHAYQVALETHKQYLMALDVIKVKAPIDVIAVTKLQREGWMGRIQVAAWPYSPDDKQIKTLAYIHGLPIVDDAR